MATEEKNSHWSHLKVPRSSVDRMQQRRCGERFVKRKQDAGLGANILSYLIDFSLKAQREPLSRGSGLSLSIEIQYPACNHIKA